MNQNEKGIIAAALYGNALVWYDFLLYASFAPLFAEIFFPSNIPFISLVATFTVFAIGFLVRPLGGLILGHYADKAGRRKALILSILAMTVATALIGCLPTYQQFGWLAAILFVLMRVIQGLAAGGELTSSVTFIVEHMFSKRRGFAGSLVVSSAFIGIFISVCIAFLLSDLLSYENLVLWGWRVAYFLGGFFGIFAVFLRWKTIESPHFAREDYDFYDLPSKVVFTRFKKALMLTVLISSVMAIGNYLLVAYVTTFLVKSQGFSLSEALLINLIALFILSLLIPCMGFLTDVFERKKIFLFGLINLLVFIFPCFWLLMQGQFHYALIGELLLVWILAPINAAVPTLIAELFNTQTRASGTAIGYNIGQAFFGGTTPLVALILIPLMGTLYAPAWYVFIWSLMVFIAMIFIFKESTTFTH